MRKVLFFSSSRSDYGLISPIIQKIKKDKNIKYFLILTSSHTNKIFGKTVQNIFKDKIKVYKIIKCNYKNQTSSILKDIISGLDKAINKIKPDIIYLPGDRYEMLSAAYIALLRNIPVFHYAGGQITEGVWDNSIRHAISKMANVHFVSTSRCKKRLISMGEEPKKIYVTGSIGVETITQQKLAKKRELEKLLQFKMNNKTVLIIYHPETLNPKKSLENFMRVIKVLDYFKNLRIIFNSPNHDKGYNEIQKIIKSFVKKNPERSIYIKSFGKKHFLSILKQVSLMIGNSSSGIIESPSFNLDCINIGDRQKGRYFSENIYNSDGNINNLKNLIIKLVNKKKSKKKTKYKNIYFKKNTCSKIYKVIKNQNLNKILIKKFYEKKN